MCVLRKCPWQHPLRRCVVLVHVHLPSESALPGCLFRRLIFLRNVCVEELWTRSPPEKRPEESVVHGLELRVVLVRPGCPFFRPGKRGNHGIR